MRTFITWVMSFFILCTITVLASSPLSPLPAGSSPSQLRKKAQELTAGLSLEEKIGQKIMLDFRFWVYTTGEGAQDWTRPNEDIGRILRKNHIGGVILFSNNLKDKEQILRLTSWLSTLETNKNFRLFIGTDNEGGNVFRLPRESYPSFPGNMALAAAVRGKGPASLAYEQGKQMASDMRALKINTNFAPVVDINSNPLNPVINIRAFSDDVKLVTLLAKEMIKGMRSQELITSFKHFPGHGDTATDSHSALPRVDRPKKDAYRIDLAPYKKLLSSSLAPDMVMTAHIQYPSLDSSTLRSRQGEDIIVPATMSRAIQTGILRKEFKFKGVIITDALDMGAISHHFRPEIAVEHIFKAGVDIALMPLSLTSAGREGEIAQLIGYIARLVKSGEISEQEITESVERILFLKLRYGLVGDEKEQLPLPLSDGKKIEKTIADTSITLIKNEKKTLPLRDKGKALFILTPQAEQGRPIEKTLKEHGFLKTSFLTQEDSPQEILRRLGQADVFIVGTESTSFTPAERDGLGQGGKSTGDKDFLRDLMQQARDQGKLVIHASLRAPYDIVDYREVAHAILASYSYMGISYNILKGPSLISLAQVITGDIKPKGKLPVNTWREYESATHTGKIAFPRGFGLSF